MLTAFVHAVGGRLSRSPEAQPALPRRRDHRMKATSSGFGDARVRTRKESRRMRAGRIVIMLRRCCDGAKISRLCVRRYLRQQYHFADISATLDVTMRGCGFRKRE